MWSFASWLARLVRFRATWFPCNSKCRWNPGPTQGPGDRGGASGSARDFGTPGPALGIEGPAQKSKNHRSLLSTGSQRSKSSKSLIQESRGHRSTRFQKSEVRGQSHVGLQDCFKGLEVTGTEVQESTAHSGSLVSCRALVCGLNTPHIELQQKIASGLEDCARSITLSRYIKPQLECCCARSLFGENRI